MSARKLSCLVLLLTSFLLVFSLLSFAQDDQQQGDPPNRVARLSIMQGSVSFEPAGENDWSQASLNYPMTSGDRLWTDKDARAELETGNVAIRMSSQTDLTTTSVSDNLIQLGLAEGTLRVRVYEMREGNSLEVDTPNAAMTITQAGNYRFDTFPDQNVTMVTVNSGTVQVSGNGVDETLGSNQAARLTGTNPVQMANVSVPGNDDFDSWSDQRDQKYLAANTRRYVSPEVPGYYDLDANGSWDTVPQYGAVWYPTTVPPGWCPYRYGRWAWVEPWGWTWVDDAPWGFAPFHYGRWVQVGVRWGWLPGPIVVAPVYGPAFVAFVGGPSFSVGFSVGSVAAWFPLGPGEPFYPWYHYSPGYLRQVNVTNVRNINLTNITNVTNVTNVNYRYRNVATTAVPTSTFRSSGQVARNMVKVTPQQLQHAQIVPHPEVTPQKQALAAGAPSAHPSVHTARPAFVEHAAVGAGHANQPGNVRQPGESSSAHNPPENTKRNETARPNSPPATNTVAKAPEQSKPTEVNRPTANNAVTQENRGGGPPPNRPTLVTKAPPPASRLPYEEKAPAMEQHPGRPLEPQQRANIQQGKPAGPMTDREYPPHPSSTRAEAPPSHNERPSSSSHEPPKK